MRKTLLASAALLGMAMALPAFAPAFAQTATDQTPANPSSIKDGTPAAGTGSGAAPGNDPVASGKTGATLGSQAPQQDPGPFGNTTNPAPASGTGTSAPSGSTSTPSAAPAGDSSGSDQSATPAAPRHRAMSSNAETGGGHWAHQPGTGESGPASAKASNIDSADTRGVIAPHLPSPDVGENASPDRYLRVAEHAIRAHKTGEAQQALEMAETRLLDRSTPAGAASQPDQNPRIAAVTSALKALATKDWSGAHSAIQQAMNSQGEAGMAPEGGAASGQMQNGMTSTSMGTSTGASTGTSTGTAVGSQGVVTPTGNPGNENPPVNPSGTGPNGTHEVGTGNGGGVLGTNTNDSAGGAK
jgi:hypothetical protein